MLCLMHESDRRGVLASSDTAWPMRDIAACISGETNHVLTCISELLRKNVAKQDDPSGTVTGVPSAIFNGRMVRDEIKRQKCIVAGKLGGNPSLTNSITVKGRVKGDPKGQANRLPTPSFAFASAKQKPPLPPLPEKQDHDALLPEMVAQAVMDRSRLAGMGLSVVLTRVAKLAADSGEDLEDLADRMVKAWDEFNQAKPRLSWFPGAAKFFGEMWDKPNAWPWAEGHAPAAARGKRKYAEVEA